MGSRDDSGGHDRVTGPHTVVRTRPRARPKARRPVRSAAGPATSSNAHTAAPTSTEPSVAARYASPRDLVGSVLSDKYELVELIGIGGMGAVYRAHQRPLGHEVAVKVIHADASASGSAQRGRFFREAKTIARLAHSATVRLFDYGEAHDGRLFMVLEFIRGPTLRTVLRDEGRLPPRRVARIVHQVLGALAEAHTARVVHRDLKPENIMLASEELAGERARVLDFGVAKIVRGEDDAEPDGDAVETRDGIVVGSPQYMAPEQSQPRGACPQSDLYALGVVMYELLAGHTPFTGPTAFDLLAAHRDAPVPELPDEAGVPAAMAAVVRRALAKSPGDRYADASAMDLAIAAALESDARASPRSEPLRVRDTASTGRPPPMPSPPRHPPRSPMPPREPRRRTTIIPMSALGAPPGEAVVDRTRASVDAADLPSAAEINRVVVAPADRGRRRLLISFTAAGGTIALALVVGIGMLQGPRDAAPLDAPAAPSNAPADDGRTADSAPATHAEALYLEARDHAAARRVEAAAQKLAAALDAVDDADALLRRARSDDAFRHVADSEPLREVLAGDATSRRNRGGRSGRRPKRSAPEGSGQLRIRKL